MNNPTKRKMPLRFVISPTILPVQEWYVVQHKKFSQSSLKLKKGECREKEPWRKDNFPKKCCRESQSR